MFDLIREIAQTMRNNKLRTFLTGIAVAWGIFMLIVLLGLARGVTNSFAANSSDERTSRITVYTGTTSKPFKGYKDGRQISPDTRDMDRLAATHPDLVERVEAYRYLGSTNITSAKDYVTHGPQGVFPKEQQLYGFDTPHGRFINDADISQRRKVMVISVEDAKTLFGDPAQAVGQRVNALGLSWLIVGVHQSNWSDDVFIPFTTAMALSSGTTELTNLKIKLKGLTTEEDAENATQAIRTSLSQSHDFDPTDQSALYINNQFYSYLRNQEGNRVLNIAIWVIGIFTLLSGIVGVSNIMFVSVKERTHEIGIRRAIGAKPRNILTQVVLESIAITTLFGYIGIVLGMALTQIIDSLHLGDEFLNPTVDISIALQVTLLLIIAGALAGFFPALKATKVKPVEALRDE